MVLGLRKKKTEVKKVIPKEVLERRLKTKITKLATTIKIPAPIQQFNVKLESVDEDKVFSLLSKYSPENRKEKIQRLKLEKEKVFKLEEFKKKKIIIQQRELFISTKESFKVIGDKEKVDEIDVIISRIDKILERISEGEGILTPENSKFVLNNGFIMSLLRPSFGPKPKILKFGMRHIVDLIENKKVSFVVIAADVTPINVIVFLPSLCKTMNIPYCIVSSKAKLGNLVHCKSTAVVGLQEVHSGDIEEFKKTIEMSNAVFMNKYDEHMTQTGGKATKRNKLE